VSPSDATVSATPAEVAAVLAEPSRRFCVTSHRNPDGDALGTLLALGRALGRRGADVVLAHPDADALPDDLGFMMRADERIRPELPDDIAERTLVCLDCASEQRLWDGEPHRAAALVVNVDHHGDNTEFGDLNLVEPDASSTAEVLVHVLEAGGWEIAPDEALPLYVALVTDTGRFGNRSAGREAHRVAGLLIESGADPAAVARRLYEQQPFARSVLLGRALAGARLLAGGRLVVARLDEDDYEAAGDDDTEGIVEVLRGVEGAAVAALVRRAGPPGAWRVSLRAVDGTDVAAIARLGGGGGHRAAAGFSTASSPDDLFAWLERQLPAQMDG